MIIKMLCLVKVVLITLLTAPVVNAELPPWLIVPSPTPPVVEPTLVYPLLEVTNRGSDDGMTGTAAGLSIDATAFSLLTSPTDAIDIPDVEFLLQAGPGFSSNPFQYDYSSGQLIIGDSIETLISADFSSLSLISLDGLSGTFSADLYNMAGSYAVQPTGRLEGTFFNSSASIFSDSDFSADIIAKVGPSAVPLPGAAVLLATGLLGMVGQVRRNRK